MSARVNEEAYELSQCPPWLLHHWQQIHARLANGRLPHAMLFTGVAGIGKKRFTRFVAESLLCREPDPQTGACGDCESCHQLTAWAHPDFLWLQPEGKSHTIKIDAVREMVNWLQLAAPAGRHRVAVADEADVMNHAAANSLLKTLEEPAERAVLLLAADKPARLPATILSRCQMTVLGVSDHALVENWLGEQGIDNAATVAKNRNIGPFVIADQYDAEWQNTQKKLLNTWRDLLLVRGSVGKLVDAVSDVPTERCLAAFAHWAVLACKYSRDAGLNESPEVVELIEQVQPALDTAQWFALYDRVLKLNRGDSASFKTQSVLEGLFAGIRLQTEAV